MSSTPASPYPPVLVRAEQAEHLDLIGHVLLADSSATAGALSSHRVALDRGADGVGLHPRMAALMACESPLSGDARRAVAS